MAKLTVTAKGQVTFKKALLQHLGVEPGAVLEVHELPGGRLEVRAERPKGNISDLFGILHREGQRAMTIEEIKEATEKAWAGEL